MLAYRLPRDRQTCYEIAPAVYAGQLRGNCMSERLSSKNAFLANHVISDRELPRFIVPMVPTWVIQT